MCRLDVHTVYSMHVTVTEEIDRRYGFCGYVLIDIVLRSWRKHTRAQRDRRHT